MAAQEKKGENNFHCEDLLFIANSGTTAERDMATRRTTPNNISSRSTAQRSAAQFQSLWAGWLDDITTMLYYKATT